MHPSISINTLCLEPDTLAAQIEFVVRLGARGISIDLEQIKAFGITETARAIGDAGLNIATVTHRAFACTSQAETAAARERLNATLEIASSIGAGSILMTTGGRGQLAWQEAADRFAEAISPCAESARQVGIPICIEPTSHLYADVSIAHRLSDTVAIARQAGINLAVDVFACWFDSDIEQAIAQAAPLHHFAQISDYVYGDRGLPCRAVPGDGAIPFERLIPAMLHSGFDGWFDLEIIGPRLLAEGVESGLRRAAAHIGSIIEGIS
ncbi:MAG: sugar phosphate isomerase/epimerase [Novosphingobium sp.]|nr:sugar phosphate isomerase/epimerase [Novosphingobium sp.]